MIADGRRAPDPFYEKPEILPIAEFYWIAFCDLVTERQIGMGLGPIPYSKARDYGLQSGVIRTEDEISQFWAIIHEVDYEGIRLINASGDDAGETTKTQKQPTAAVALGGNVRQTKTS